MNEIKKNLEEIKARIEAACKRSNRSTQDVKILLATKTVSVERVSYALNEGIDLIGENKVQEFLSKYEDFKKLSPRPELHFIGHLQSNKVKEIYDKVDLLHSLDRPKLLKELDKRLRDSGKKIKALVQVNTSNEESKYGLHENDVLPFIEKALSYKTIELAGFMTLAEFSSDKDIIRKCFVKLRSIKDAAESAFQIKLPELSMGMSSDFEEAIEEGATIIRVGTAVFGAREYPDSYYWPKP